MLISSNQSTLQKINKLPSVYWFLNRNSEKPIANAAIGCDGSGSGIARHKFYHTLEVCQQQPQTTA